MQFTTYFSIYLKYILARNCILFFGHIWTLKKKKIYVHIVITIVCILVCRGHHRAGCVWMSAFPVGTTAVCSAMPSKRPDG